VRVAVVDIGTNSTRLLVADVGDGGHVDELERRSVVTRLGQGVDAGGALGDDAIGRVLATLGEYRDAIERHGARRALAVLTSAVRDASNGPAFERRVRDEFGLDARTIGGAEEARLTFRGATSERDAGAPAPVVVIDIGGGSTELVVGARGDVRFHASTQAGVVRHTERYLHSDPPVATELTALQDDVRETFAAAVPADVRASTRAAIAVAGTPTSLAAINQNLDPYDTARVHGYRLPLRRCEELLAELAAMPEHDRALLPGLQPARAPTIVAGTAMLIEALRLFALQSAEVSEHDILRGVALEAVHHTA
jgi:exopolyphosphatase/guanosine-5'-triphosphate,3'-diphosphate pyrophosphatase